LNNLVQSSKSGSGLTNADVIALINTYSKRQVINNTIENAPLDLDSTNAGSEIIHRLIHHFLEKIIAKDLAVEIISAANIVADSIITEDFRALPNGTPSIVNQVLTAVDTIGTAEWKTPTTVTPFNTQVSSISNQAFVGGAFNPISGLSLFLPTPGMYLITCSMALVMTTNDTEIQIVGQHNNSGAMANLPGWIIVSKDATASWKVTPSKTWALTTTINDVNVIVIAAKIAGSGTSFSRVNDSTLTATKVG
jgi:hypothetical protein